MFIGYLIYVMNEDSGPPGTEQRLKPSPRPPVAHVLAGETGHYSMQGPDYTRAKLSSSLGACGGREEAPKQPEGTGTCCEEKMTSERRSEE